MTESRTRYRVTRLHGGWLFPYAVESTTEPPAEPLLRLPLWVGEFWGLRGRYMTRRRAWRAVQRFRRREAESGRWPRVISEHPIDGSTVMYRDSPPPTFVERALGQPGMIEVRRES